MLQLRIYGPSESLTDLGRGLEDDGGARNVALAPGVRTGHVLLTAEVHPEFGRRGARRACARWGGPG